MSNVQSSGRAAAEQISALVDGELAGDEVARACAAWRGDASLRGCWHAYHLIGDVLRSDDLASAPSRDERFLRQLRGRLAQEPTVLAPRAAPAVPLVRLRRRWRAGAAVAAGFVLVAGVLVVTQSPPPEPAAASMAQVPSPVVPVAATTASPAADPGDAMLVTDGKILRDARLDRYLAAHQRFAGASALGVPSSFLRSATAPAPQR